MLFVEWVTLGKSLTLVDPSEPQCQSLQRGFIPRGQVSAVVSPGHRAWPPPKARALSTGVVVVLQKKQNCPGWLLLSELCSLGRKKGNRCLLSLRPHPSAASSRKASGSPPLLRVLGAGGRQLPPRYALRICAPLPCLGFPHLSLKTQSVISSQHSENISWPD